jgi:hypothetical protein
MYFLCRFRWPRGLRRRSAAARLLGSQDPIYLRTWIVYLLCVLSDTVLSLGLITRSEESYWMCVYVCNTETWTVRRPGPELGCWVTEKIVKTSFCYKWKLFLIVIKISVTFKVKTQYQFVRSKTCLANKLDSKWHECRHTFCSQVFTLPIDCHTLWPFPQTLIQYVNMVVGRWKIIIRCPE